MFSSDVFLKFLLTLTAIFSLGECRFQSKDEAAKRINGALLSQSPRPFFVKLEDPKSGMRCGGTIISHYSVLTAAHCFDPIFKSQLTVHTLDKKKQTIPVDFKKNVVMHEHYVYQNRFADLAVVNFDKPVFDKEEVLKLCPKGTAHTIENEHLRACGMGKDQNKPVNRLSEVELFEIKTPAKFHTRPKEFDGKTQMVFESTFSRTHPGRLIPMSEGDPGNPIFSAERTKSTKQDPEGLISRAECLYGVVTQEWVGERVGAYHDWIKKHMKTK